MLLIRGTIALSCIILVTSDEQQFENYTIRLIGDSSENSSNIGWLEIKYEGEWSRICINDWTGENSHVACRQLGYSRGYQLYSDYVPDTSVNYRVDFTCNGFEDSLKYCKQNLYNDLFCFHPVKLRCYEELNDDDDSSDEDFLEDDTSGNSAVDDDSGINTVLVIIVVVSIFAFYFCFYVCICHRAKKRNRPTSPVTNNASTTQPTGVINEGVEYQYQLNVLSVVTSSSPGPAQDLPPSYASVMIDDRIKSSIESPPPSYVQSQWSLFQGNGNI